MQFVLEALRIPIQSVSPLSINQHIIMCIHSNAWVLGIYCTNNYQFTMFNTTL